MLTTLIHTLPLYIYKWKMKCWDKASIQSCNVENKEEECAMNEVSKSIWGKQAKWTAVYVKKLMLQVLERLEEEIKKEERSSFSHAWT